METFNEETKRAFEATLEWLHEWACSRNFGLGTKLPWDTKYVIESLSDSTIYMAYYTVSHLLQGANNLEGSRAGPSGITPENMTDAIWNYICRGEVPTKDQWVTSGASREAVEVMRRELLYWYPMDLRSSGKELIGNHLTFSIYNHVALFSEELWPKAFRTNGHMLINAEKMSKSLGNFITLRDGIKKYSADGVRFALADAGDTFDDANFAEKTADDAVLKLYTLITLVEESLDKMEEMREGPVSEFFDRVFEAQLNRSLRLCSEAYDRLLFREALKVGFYELQEAFGHYRVAYAADKGPTSMIYVHRDLFKKFILWQTQMMAPICPHSAEHLWRLICQKLGLPHRSVFDSTWPSLEKVDDSVLLQFSFLSDVLHRVRIGMIPKKKKKGQEDSPTTFTQVSFFVCRDLPTWQAGALLVFRSIIERFGGQMPDDINSLIIAELPSHLKSQMKRIMPFVGMIRDEFARDGPRALIRDCGFSEDQVLTENQSFVLAQLGLQSMTISFVEDTSSTDKVTDMQRKILEEAQPLKPSFILS
uniref:Leucine--tRNA ligase n=1 Tax=Compsopogon caeruleus TaxID=31354 RepID=A0A7S1T6S6_9RHOD